jgi:hypothetical protein
LSLFFSFLLFAFSSSVDCFRAALGFVGFEPPLLAPLPGPLTVVVLADSDDAAAACSIEFSELAHGDPEPAEALCGSVN